MPEGLDRRATIPFNEGDNLSWFDGFDLYDNESYTYNNDNCCGGGDVCDLNEGMHFEAQFIPALYSVVFVVGVLGNGLLLGVLAKSRRTWSVTDTFILHLGVADVLLLLTLPFWAAQAVQGWTFGTPFCKITGAIFTINFYCGIFLLACISLDRYLSIVHATQMYSRKKPWVVQASCLAVWLTSMLLSIPDWIFLDDVEDERRNKKECIRNYFKFSSQRKIVEDWRLASRLIYHIAGFLLPSVVLIFCYTSILRRLRCGTHGLQKQKAFRVILAVVLVFFLCWAPYNITLMVDTIQSGNISETCGVRSYLEKAKTVTSSVGYLHCSLNPILYAFVGVKFRRQLLNILRSLGCKLKTSVRLQSVASSRKSSIWSESADTSNSIAI
ncbi:C-X-C chemokine receptor type 3.1 [Scomber scombrus]|uniref:C-X-C chemokine receptor type 3 n=1 Tax=Scomber scombrus TaxID=13677 RepID=A0AAV1Q0B7_SCOSC